MQHATVQSARSMSVSKIGKKIQYIVKFEHFKSTEFTVDKKKKMLMCTDMKELYATSIHQVFTHLFPDSNREIESLFENHEKQHS